MEERGCSEVRNIPFFVFIQIRKNIAPAGSCGWHDWRNCRNSYASRAGIPRLPACRGVTFQKQVRYEILPVTVGIRFVGRIAVFGIKARHAVCARKEHLRTDVVLQACIPAQHGQCLHLSFVVGIGNNVHIQGC